MGQTTFSAIGFGDTLYFEAGETINYSLIGTFVADMSLVLCVSNKGVAAKEVIVSTTVDVSGSYEVSESGYYAWRCNEYTSGSPIATISENQNQVAENEAEPEVTGWGDYADDEYTEGSPFSIAADTDTEIPNNAQSGVTSQVPDDVADAGGFFVASHIVFTGLVGSFVVGETITGGTSSDTAVITEVDAINSRLFLKTISGDFQDAETITGGTSGATATTSGDRVPGTITGRNGDGVNVLIDFKVKPTTGSATRIDVFIDITGGTGSPASLANLYRRSFTLSKGQNVEHFFTMSVAGYTLNTWEANGGVMKINATAGVDIYEPRVVLTRTHKAS